MARSGEGRGRRFWRGFLIFLALGMGAVAAWLVVLGHSQKQMQLGVLIGLWGLFLAFAAHTDGRRAPSADEVVAVPGAELATLRDADERRDFELRLELAMRREIEGIVRTELADLRDEVAHLRSDMVEQVGGQLRLERIETTRVIGSDIEALHDEVRRLAVAREAFAAGQRQALSGPLPYVEPIAVRGVSAPPAPFAPPQVFAAPPPPVVPPPVVAPPVVQPPLVSPPAPVAVRAMPPSPRGRPTEPLPSIVATSAAGPVSSAGPAPSAAPPPAVAVAPVAAAPPAAPAPAPVAPAPVAPAAAAAPAVAPPVFAPPPAAAPAAAPVPVPPAGPPFAASLYTPPPRPPAAAPVPQPTPQPAPLWAPEPAPAPRFADPLAGLPRLSRFVDDGPPPVTRMPEPEPSLPQPAAPPGGRRRRADDESNDVLDRLLGRVH